jgi:protein-S-isoprenylcysteine O-methyltransferase Ste14
MCERASSKEIFGNLIGVIITVFAVIGASFLWQLPHAYGWRAVLITYIASIILMVIGAFMIFNRVVRREYERHHGLAPFSILLQCLIWGMFFAFPSIYNPANWAWSQSHISLVIPIIGGIGWVFVGFGLVIVIFALAWLGIRRSFGQGLQKLEVSGPYHMTRNPQLMGGLVLVIGYLVLWPSWFAVGWLALYIITAHMMVLTEEKHLQANHGEMYAQYCKRVPRYLRLSWRRGS